MHRILQEKPGRAQNSKLEDSMPSEYRTEFRVEDSGLNVYHSGFRVSEDRTGLRDESSGFSVYMSGFWVQGLELRM